MIKKGENKDHLWPKMVPLIAHSLVQPCAALAARLPIRRREFPLSTHHFNFLDLQRFLLLALVLLLGLLDWYIRIALTDLKGWHINMW
jgi:hypothetical protein